MALPLPTVRRAWSTRVPRQAAAKLDDAQHLQVMRLLYVPEDDGLAILNVGTVYFLAPGWYQNPQTPVAVGGATVEDVHYSAGGGVTGGILHSTLDSYPGAVICGDYRIVVPNVASNWRRRDMRGRSAGFDVWLADIPIAFTGINVTAPLRLPVGPTGARVAGFAVCGDAMPGAVGGSVWVSRFDTAGAWAGDISAATTFHDVSAPSGALDFYPTPYPTARVEPGSLGFNYNVHASSPMTVLHFAVKVYR